MELFVLKYVHEFENGEEDIKLIGLYSSEENARQAIKRLQRKPGFRERPRGFQLDPMELDRDHWVNGFNSFAELIMKP
jgi:hypothetical protein